MFDILSPEDKLMALLAGTLVKNYENATASVAKKSSIIIG
jgi:hypothetical protein